MQNLVSYSKWSCPLPATLFTPLSAIGGSAVVSHYKNHLIVFLIIPSCSEQPVYCALCVSVCGCMCVCVCTVAAKWSLYLPPTFSLSLLRCLSVLSPHYKTTLSPSPPFSSSYPFLSLPLPPPLSFPLYSQPPFPRHPSLSSPSRYLSLTHYPTAWSNQSAICEWKLSPHTVSLYYIESALCLKLCPKPLAISVFFNSKTN